MNNWIQIPLDDSWGCMDGMGFLCPESVKFLEWYKTSFWILRDLIILSIIHIMVIAVFWIGCFIKFALSPCLLWEIWYSTWCSEMASLYKAIERLKSFTVGVVINSQEVVIPKWLLIKSNAWQVWILAGGPSWETIILLVNALGVATKSMEYWVFELRPSMLTLETLLCKSSSSDGIFCFLLFSFSFDRCKFSRDP